MHLNYSYQKKKKKKSSKKINYLERPKDNTISGICLLITFGKSSLEIPDVSFSVF